MRAKVPLDIDLEDKLVFGLTPTRFGYLAAGGLGAVWCWSALAAPAGGRLAVAVSCLAMGAAIAWGRVAGRSLDQWLIDAVLYVARNYALELRSPVLMRAPRSETAVSSHAHGHLPRVAARAGRVVFGTSVLPVRGVIAIGAALTGALRWLVEPQSI